MSSSTWTIVLSLLTAGCVAVAGCHKPDAAVPADQGADEHAADGHDHDGHDHGDGEHPETLAEAVTQVAALNAEIKSGLAADEKDKVHEALHEVGHILEDAANMLKQDGLSAADQQEANGAINQLLDGYGQVDEKLYHGGEGKSYDEVSAKLDEAIAKLESLTKPKDE